MSIMWTLYHPSGTTASLGFSAYLLVEAEGGTILFLMSLLEIWYIFS